MYQLTFDIRGDENHHAVYILATREDVYKKICFEIAKSFDIFVNDYCCAKADGETYITKENLTNFVELNNSGKYKMAYEDFFQKYLEEESKHDEGTVCKWSLVQPQFAETMKIDMTNWFLGTANE